MKLYSLLFLCFSSAQAHAEIIQHHAVLDDAFVSVRAGQQQNGTLAIDRTIYKTTTSAQEALSSAAVTFNDRSLFFGSRPRDTSVSTFNLASEVAPENDKGITISSLPNKPTTPIPPVIPAVPEPETYALMALGLATMFFRKKIKIP